MTQDNLTSWVLIAACFVGVTTISSHTSSGQTVSLDRSVWIGAKVMPKLDAEVKVENLVIDGPGNHPLSVPWTVQDVNGDWLWVGDARKGWVKRSQVCTLDEAPAYYQSLIARGEQIGFAYGLRAITWEEKGELDLAIADLGEVLRLDPTAGDYSDRGNVWRKKKEYDKAIADFNHAIRLDPKFEFAYNNRGLAWADKKEYDKAISDFSQAIRLDSKDVFALRNRGWAWAKKGEYEKAFADFNLAIQLDLNDGSAYVGRGSALAEKGEYDKAIADYDEALRLNPKDDWAFLERGRAWVDKGDYDRAIADFNRCLELSPDDSSAQENRGLAWSKKGEYDKALADFSQNLRLHPKSASAYEALAWFQSTCPDDRYRNAKKAFENATEAYQLSFGNQWSILDTLAASYAESGDFERAREWQTKALNLADKEKDIQACRERLELYRQSKPFRQPRVSPSQKGA